MNNQDEYENNHQKIGMDTPNHCIDLRRYTSVVDIELEVEKLKQDVEIRRNVHQRMSVDSNDETVMIIEEKIKLLEAKKREVKSEQKTNRNVVYIVLFSLVFIPLLFTAPLHALIFAGVVIAIRAILVLLRKLFQRLNQSMQKLNKSMEESIKKLEARDDLKKE